jgi:DNA recombination protein RmuC
MPDSVLWVALAGGALLLVALLLLAIALARLGAIATDRAATAATLDALRTETAVLKAQGQDLERDLKLDLAGNRREHLEVAQSLRGEIGERIGQFTVATAGQLQEFGTRLTDFTRLTHEQLRGLDDSQKQGARTIVAELGKLREASEARLEAVRQTIEQRLDLLRDENAQKLEQMRATVDEKLQATLETRLGESFKLVSDRLEQVHKGLGEMQTLATGVGDLKRVLTNVKKRGTWGEMQLGALLAEVLTPGQYATNVETVPGSGKRVEFALRMPAPADEPACWIPVDAKFPVEEWERLQDALERTDPEAAESARRALATFLRQQARAVRSSYVAPPHTSDFAFLYLPTESLYAEMMARPGLADELQREHRVIFTGPSNFLALLNIVQMGFRSVAIEQRSAEVWRTLGAVRTEFGKFGDVLARAKKKLDEASNTLDEARGKTTTIARKLREVEALPEPDAARLLGGVPSPDVSPGDDVPLEDK